MKLLVYRLRAIGHSKAWRSLRPSCCQPSNITEISLGVQKLGLSQTLIARPALPSFECNRDLPEFAARLLCPACAKALLLAVRPNVMGIAIQRAKLVSHRILSILPEI